MVKRALLLIDVQRDFLPGGAVPTEEKGIVPIIVDLLNRNVFDVTVASQDWHPQVLQTVGVMQPLLKKPAVAFSL